DIVNGARSEGGWRVIVAERGRDTVIPVNIKSGARRLSWGYPFSRLQRGGDPACCSRSQHGPCGSGRTRTDPHGPVVEHVVIVRAVGTGANGKGHGRLVGWRYASRLGSITGGSVRALVKKAAESSHDPVFDPVADADRLGE